MILWFEELLIGWKGWIEELMLLPVMMMLGSLY